MGTVVAITAAVVATGAAIAAGKALFGGGGGHDSGPKRTFEKQKRWDNKREEIQSRLRTLESQRDAYFMNSNRFEDVQRRKTAMELKIQAAETRLASAREKQREMEGSLNEMLKSDAINAVLAFWENEGTRHVDQIKENCPLLDELTSDMADIHNKLVEEQTQKGFNLLKKYRDEQIAERKKKIKDHQQAEVAERTLLGIIQRLKVLQDEAR